MRFQSRDKPLTPRRNFHAKRLIDVAYYIAKEISRYPYAQCFCRYPQNPVWLIRGDKRQYNIRSSKLLFDDSSYVSRSVLVPVLGFFKPSLFQKN